MRDEHSTNTRGSTLIDKNPLKSYIAQPTKASSGGIHYGDSLQRFQPPTLLSSQELYPCYWISIISFDMSIIDTNF